MRRLRTYIGFLIMEHGVVKDLTHDSRGFKPGCKRIEDANDEPLGQLGHVKRDNDGESETGQR